jgi:hypothetical protein
LTPGSDHKGLVSLLSQVVRYTTDTGSPVAFEIAPVGGFVPAGSADELVGRIKDAMGPVVEAARVVLDQVRAAGPDHVEVKFGVKVTGTMNWLVAKAASEGNFEVTLSWAADRRDAAS